LLHAAPSRREFPAIFSSVSEIGQLFSQKLYRGHAVIETIIEELKNDFGTGIAHAAEFHVNATMTVCRALAYNIKNSLFDFHKMQLRQGERMKLSTFPSRWLRIPGLFSRSSNRRILRIQQAAYDPCARLQIAA
jgi:hypothetical protein